MITNIPENPIWGLSHMSTTARCLNALQCLLHGVPHWSRRRGQQNNNPDCIGLFLPSFLPHSSAVTAIEIDWFSCRAIIKQELTNSVRPP